MIWPLVLIVLGLLFLAHNLDFIQWKELRDLLSTWWPLILIAAGLGQLARRKR